MGGGAFRLAARIEHPTMRFVLTVAGLAVSASLHAHDFWLEPSAHRADAGKAVAVRLRVGEHFRGDPVPRDPQRILRFVALGPAGETPIRGGVGADPAGVVRLTEPGLHVIAYRSRPRPHLLAAEKFEAYLMEEGLERVIALRAERGETAKPGRELFSRCAKALVAVGDAGGGHDLGSGLPLELVAEANPYASSFGRDLPVRLFYDDRPLAGALVVAIPREAPEAKIATRSDADGRVVFRLSRGGHWLIKAVHMVAARTPGADWESLWASLTFELPEP